MSPYGGGLQNPEVDVDAIIVEARGHNSEIRRERDEMFEWCAGCGKGFRGKRGVAVHLGRSEPCELRVRKETGAEAGVNVIERRLRFRAN